LTISGQRLVLHDNAVLFFGGKSAKYIEVNGPISNLNPLSINPQLWKTK
jgi:hypothetical protein